MLGLLWWFRILSCLLKHAGITGSHLKEQSMIALDESEAFLRSSDRDAVTEGVDNRASQAFVRVVRWVEQLEALRETFDVERRESLIFLAHVRIVPDRRFQDEIAFKALPDSDGEVLVEEAITKLVDLEVSGKPYATLRLSEVRDIARLPENLTIDQVQVNTKVDSFDIVEGEGLGLRLDESRVSERPLEVLGVLDKDILTDGELLVFGDEEDLAGSRAGVGSPGSDALDFEAIPTW